MSDDFITGVDTLMKRLTVLQTKSANRVMASAIRGGLNVIGRQMRKDLDPKVKFGG